MEDAEIDVIVAQAFACAHRNSALVRKDRYDGKGAAVWRQCQSCGETLERVPVRALAPHALRALSALDEEIARRYYQAATGARRRMR